MRKTITLGNDLAHVVQMIDIASHLEFDLDEYNGDPAMHLKLVLNPSAGGNRPYSMLSGVL